jgi:N-acetylmuramoyl-L-alanine amidase
MGKLSESAKLRNAAISLGRMEASKPAGRGKKSDDMTNLPVFLLDNGHGGLIDGVYQTSGKRSPIWDDGTVLYEGEFNRDIVRRIMMLMDAYGYPYVNLVPEQEDISLYERTEKRADVYYDTVSKNCIYLSVHANAGGGTGFEFFTSPSQNKSDDYAEIMIEEYGYAMTELRLVQYLLSADLWIRFQIVS